MFRHLLLLALISTAIWYWFNGPERKSQPPRNARNTASVALKQPTSASTRLALGADGRSDELHIGIQEPVELDGLRKSEILTMRSRAVMAYPLVVADAYTPSESVFGQIVDGAPWWGIEGQFRYGPGTNSIVGPSEESRFILNPYLLASPEFNDWWPSLSDAEAVGFPYHCPPQSLVWWPREARAEAVYSAACIAQRQHPQFDLIAYNARDMGLPFMYVAYEESENIGKPAPPTVAYDNPQYIHKGGSCGYPGGCNNMSPQTPPIDGIVISALPAKIVIRFWRIHPASVAGSPDMKYVITIR